jgi:hypothetical protein
MCWFIFDEKIGCVSWLMRFSIVNCFIDEMIIACCYYSIQWLSSYTSIDFLVDENLCYMK